MVQVRSKQDIRQAARRAAREKQAKLRADRVAAEKRLGDLAVAAMTAVGERAAVVAEHDIKAGAAVRALVDEGLTYGEVREWMGEEISVREVRRLAGVADKASDEQEDEGKDESTAER